MLSFVLTEHHHCFTHTFCSLPLHFIPPFACTEVCYAGVTDIVNIQASILFLAHLHTDWCFCCVWKQSHHPGSMAMEMNLWERKAADEKGGKEVREKREKIVFQPASPTHASQLNSADSPSKHLSISFPLNNLPSFRIFWCCFTCSVRFHRN